MVKGHTIQAVILHTLCLLVCSIALFSFGSDEARALQGPSVLIHAVQASGLVTNTNDQEYILITNRSNQAVDITNWCVRYATQVSAISCVKSTDPAVRFMLPSYGSAVFITEALRVQQPQPYDADAILTADTIAMSSGGVTLLNGAGTAVDQVEWSNNQIIGAPANSDKLTNGKILQRVSSDGILQYTGVQKDDFKVVGNTNVDGRVVVPRSSVFEVIFEYDYCSNIEGLQAAVPDGHFLDGDECHQDICQNLPDIQTTLPIGYRKVGERCELIQLSLTELLPDPNGADSGQEFVEIYNPNSFSVDLDQYVLALTGGSRSFVVKGEREIAAHEYMVLSDSELGFLMPNASGGIVLMLPDGSVVDRAEYGSTKAGMSWALLDGIWYLSATPSPGAANIQPEAASDSSVGGVGAGQLLADCGEGRYRHPETNRCRNVTASDEALQPCASDQQRNPETNRCRKIATTSTLQPCAADQFRNPETNRCKKIVSTTASLKPCAEGQERNPETNRCRKVSSPGAVLGSGLEGGASTLASEPLYEKYRLPIVGMLSAVLAGYGAYEYRTDIKNYLETARDKRRRGRPPG